MTDKPNFILVQENAPQSPPAARRGSSALARLRSAAATIAKAAKPAATALRSALAHAEPPAEAGAPERPRLVFAVDATASREPTWAAARQVTDVLVKAMPGELDVALAVHGGSRVHTFTAFTNDANTLRDRAAGVTCQAGLTRMLPILSASLKQPAVRVVIYIGDVFEESLSQGRELTDAMGRQGIRLIVLHDTADHAAARSAELFWDLAKRAGGCVLPFDASASGRLRDLLSAVAVYAVGGQKLLRARQHAMPGAVVLLDHLNRRH